MAKKQRQKEVTTSPVKEYVGIIGVCILSFLLRVLGQLDRVFVKDFVLFRGVDSWYHMRLVDAMRENFPYHISWDMFAQYPGGAANGYPPMLTWMGSIASFVGGETLVAYIPPLLLVGIVLLTYLLGRELFNGKVGLLAALFVAILPGELFHRSLLGFFDHHVLETLLATASIFLFSKAFRTEKLKWMVLAGVTLGAYHLTWAGTTLFILILLLWLWFEFLRRLRSEEDQSLLVKLFGIPGFIAFIFSLALTSPIPKALSLLLAVAPVVTWLLTKLVKDKSMLLFALTAITPIAIILTTMSFRYELLQLSAMFWGGATYIGEAQPIELGVLLATFGLAAVLLPGGLWFGKKDKYTALFWIWAITMLLANIGQRRWGYYTIIPISTLSAFFVLYSLKWVTQNARTAVVAVIIAFMIGTSFTNIHRLATIPNNINADWHVASTWFRDNTPEPFETENAYYKISLEEEPSYGVMCWWDYGHWIIRLGRRVPLTSPTQTGGMPSEFFASRTFQEAEQVLGDANVKYIIIDQELLEGKWYAVNQRSHKDTPVEESVAYKVWNSDEQSPYKLVYDGERIKIFER